MSAFSLYKWLVYQIVKIESQMLNIELHQIEKKKHKKLEP